MATARGRLRTVELPSTFRERQHGESKLDSKIALDFAALVTAKVTNDAVSPRFLLFCLVGLTGIGIHLSILSGLLAAALSFGAAQALATVGAIAWNFVLNNLFTYRDQRLTGWNFVTGLVRFQVICAIGAISNVGIATWIYDYDEVWWIAGLGGALDRHGLELRGQCRPGLAAALVARHFVGLLPPNLVKGAEISVRGRRQRLLLGGTGVICAR